MKRIFLLPLTAAAVWCAMPVHADEPVETDSMTPDSMKLYELQQIQAGQTLTHFPHRMQLAVSILICTFIYFVCVLCVC